MFIILGNSWGTNRQTGRSCVGCGPQEQFYGCADISIGQGRPGPVANSNNRFPNRPAGHAQAPTDQLNYNGRPHESAVGQGRPVPLPFGTSNKKKLRISPKTNIQRPDYGYKYGRFLQGNVQPGPFISGQRDKWTGNWQQPWAKSNGLRIKSRHQSTGSGRGLCIATGAWAGQSDMDQWCLSNCALGNCPATHCRCR